MNLTFPEKTKARLQMTNQVAETCQRAEDTDAPELARTLYMYMADIPLAAPMLPLLLKATTGSQTSNLLAVNTPNFATVNTMVIERLQQWQSWHITREAGRAASDAAKVACLACTTRKIQQHGPECSTLGPRWNDACNQITNQLRPENGHDSSSHQGTALGRRSSSGHSDRAQGRPGNDHEDLYADQDHVVPPGLGPKIQATRGTRGHTRKNLPTRGEYTPTSRRRTARDHDPHPTCDKTHSNNPPQQAPPQL